MACVKGGGKIVPLEALNFLFHMEVKVGMFGGFVMENERLKCFVKIYVCWFVWQLNCFYHKCPLLHHSQTTLLPPENPKALMHKLIIICMQL